MAHFWRPERRGAIGVEAIDDIKSAPADQAAKITAAVADSFRMTIMLLGIPQ